VEDHDAVFVTSKFVPSVKYALANKLIVEPIDTDGAVGVTTIDAIDGGVTVNVTKFEVTLFSEALMLLLPWASALAIPLLFTVITVASLENQLTEPEILPVVLSEYVPIAVKILLDPLGEVVLEAVILIPVTTAAVTEILTAAELTPLIDAETVVVPTATPVTKPTLLTMLAVDGAAEIQFT